eukprot:scaffold140369_cov16-Tisochrysis_lutea.AAC.1
MQGALGCIAHMPPLSLGPQQWSAAAAALESSQTQASPKLGGKQKEAHASEENALAKIASASATAGLAEGCDVTTESRGHAGLEASALMQSQRQQQQQQQQGSRGAAAPGDASLGGAGLAGAADSKGEGACLVGEGVVALCSLGGVRVARFRPSGDLIQLGEVPCPTEMGQAIARAQGGGKMGAAGTSGHMLSRTDSGGGGGCGMGLPLAAWAPSSAVSGASHMRHSLVMSNKGSRSSSSGGGGTEIGRGAEELGRAGITDALPRAPR